MRLRFIEEHGHGFAVNRLCKVLDVSERGPLAPIAAELPVKGNELTWVFWPTSRNSPVSA